MHPLLPSHPTHAVAGKCLVGGGPACFLMHLAVSKDKLVDKAKRLHGELEYKTSFGGRSLRIDPWPFIGPSDVYDGAPGEASGVSNRSREAMNKSKTVDRRNGTWIRVSVGWEQDVEVAMTYLDYFFRSVVTI
eukprot:TRINITY_DN28420_c0_g1_i1.p1 TRINITY_DN28420_c0_g1~~TRINITY_DN28420_c0_g1_i1.p1  ORF type:complete len:133 (+),score=18.13 TRINITY_DN28420_c0_g1_i1:86-484(+)